MNTQPETEQLIEALESDNSSVSCRAAAADLRRLRQSEQEGWRYANELEFERKRLHAANQELLEALEMGYADTMDYIRLNHLTGAENNRWLVLARAAIAKHWSNT